MSKAKMAPRADAPPGLEQDQLGNPIPFDQRTEEDQEKAQKNIAEKMHKEAGSVKSSGQKSENPASKSQDR